VLTKALQLHLPPPLLAANNMFSEALALWPLCWEAWMAWGKFCDTMYDKSKEAQWLEFLATCYLQVQCACNGRAGPFLTFVHQALSSILSTGCSAGQHRSA